MSRVVASPPFSLRPLVLGLPVLVACFAVDAEEAVELEAQQITAPREVERGNGPVEGYVAKRSVGATKTDTPIIETPQSISVITADRIRDQGSLTIQDSLRYVAGMRGEAYGIDSRGDSALVRGTSPGIFLDGLQKGVGYYNNTRTDPFTLERIEVLKGPSSMLYGQSPVGGLLNLVSKRPQAEQRSELQLQYGSFDRKQIAFDSTGPLDDDGTLLYRVVAIQRDSQTQVDHTKDNRLVFMPSLTWRPNEQFEWTLMANVQKDDSGTTSSFLPHRGTVLSAPYGKIDTDRFVSEPGFDEYDTEQKALTSQMSWQLDDTWTLRQNLRWQKSKVSYQTMYGYPFGLNPDDRTINRVYSVSKPEVTIWTADHQAESRFNTGELQHTMLVGVDYQHSVTDEKSAFDVATPLDVYAPVYGSFDPSVVSLTDVPQQRTSQKGLYVQDQIRYQKWLMTLGLRKDWADTRVEDGDRQKDDAVTGRVGLTYLFDNGVAPYISYSESFSPIIGLNADTQQSYKPLEGEQWELGVKYQPPGSNTLLTAAVFDLREQNRQIFGVTPRGDRQAGETQVRGVELEGLVEVTPEWNLIATYTYLDSEIVEGEEGEQGNRIASVPEHMASLWSQHRFSIAGIPGFSAGAGVRYVGASWDGADDVKTPSTTLFDAMLGYAYQDWSFTLNATNLEDETYYTTCLSRGDCFIGNRRTVVATASYSF
ncbi:TonB-dependent siderophore receptor [Pseudomonas stutzeri]|jgi:iron complex outermembrane receptor protein|uniref:Metal-pseudopaline receptor CntO n=1 Tax=Stutzerimonas stutzeri NF13 TaxID=1212548 RepID=M2ULR6_STUST|nr:TonB-dependent siderophore receptor [Stutzerimonas stutzeri]EMD99489.1 putative TonB-dependent receptor [Stutzerimonas stutzeri NF13]MBK3879615.1 TonB-dependent siderophore receptor [Stutzerimonas stutzeri]MCQ4291366.1 TonB-dependent siderophore receptor [Stutzerimonas stutzeri]